MPAAVFIDSVFCLGFADGAFQVGEEEGERLRIVPDMLTGSFAGAAFGSDAFPAPERAVFDAQAGRGDEHCEICRRALERRLGNRAVVQSFAEEEDLFADMIEIRENLCRRIRRAGAEFRVIVFPAVFFYAGFAEQSQQPLFFVP